MLSQFLWIDGRSGRLTWWLTGVLQVCLVMLAAPFLIRSNAAAAADSADLLSTLFVVVVLLFGAWLGLVANIRRYHDRNKSGWWVLFAFVPLIGPLWQLIELGFLSGDLAPNDFGPPSDGGSDIAGEISDLRSRSGGLAKVDDAYLADYAKSYAAAQSAQAVGPAAATATGGGTFGRRR